MTGVDAVSTVKRAALVLSAFRGSWDFLTLTDVVTITGLTKPTVFRILSSLVAEGLVFQNEANGSFGLGFLNLRLADVFLSMQPVRDAVAPAMRRIHAALNENVALGVRDGDMTYDLEVLGSTQMIAPSQSCGDAVLLHESVAGRALLADMPSDESMAYFGRHVRKSRRDRLRRDLIAIHEAGYASAPSGILVGGHTIAKALRGGGVLAITLPLARFTLDLEARAIDLLEAAAQPF